MACHQADRVERNRLVETIECDESTEPSNTGQATATDNCDPAPEVTFSDEITPGVCPQEYVITRTWTATDMHDNINSAVQTITVVDTTAPVLSVPSDVTIECTESAEPSNTGQATATDACHSAPIVTFHDSLMPGSCPQEWVITRTWTATDECELATTYDQVNTVVDTIAPVITNLGGVPLVQQVGEAIDFEAYFEDDCSDAYVVAWDFGDTEAGDGEEPYVIDPADSPTIASHVYTEPGIYTLTLTVTDDCGNQASDNLVLVVFDPEGGFATGARWFISDEDTIVDGNPLSDKSAKGEFRFVVRYRPNHIAPSGSLDFRFQGGDIKLHSTQLDWLVVSGQQVYFKGLAAINGEGEYAFRVTGRDVGKRGRGRDEFNNEVWDGDLDTENNPPTPHHRFHGVLGGGNIMIHK